MRDGCLRLARPEERRSVLRLTLRSVGQSASDVEDQVTRFVQYARAMRLDLSRQWVVQRGGRFVAACVCVESPGGTAMLLVPSPASAGFDGEALAGLIEHGVAEERSREYRFIQCLLHPSDVDSPPILTGLGFRPIAELIYLEREVGPIDPPLQPAGPVQWIGYSSAHHGLFGELILATYDHSLDCPALCGLREIDDIIAGHMASGRFRADRWRLLLVAGRPAGCILMNENPLAPVLDVVYMGVHPELRGKGLGRLLAASGLSMAQREGMAKVTLAVDSANSPARRLYASLGFEETARRMAWVRHERPTPRRP